MSSEGDEDAVEHLKFKVVLLGDASVGKTSIVQQLVLHQFHEEYQPTVGVEFYKAEMPLRPGTHATLQLWDIGSQVKSLQMAANYLQGCDAVVIVHDLTNKETYAAACQWLQIVQQMFQETGLPLVAFVANKADTADVQAQAAQLPAPTSDLFTFSRYCVSAKTGYNVQNALASITAQLAGFPLQLEEASLPTEQQRNNDTPEDTKPTGKRPRLLQALRSLADRCCPCR